MPSHSPDPSPMAANVQNATKASISGMSRPSRLDGNQIEVTAGTTTISQEANTSTRTRQRRSCSRVGKRIGGRSQETSERVFLVGGLGTGPSTTADRPLLITTPAVADVASDLPSLVLKVS